MSEGFQIKLYHLVTEGRSGVTWNNVGDSIYIDVPKFKKFLSRANSFCKSKNVTSFIRQLNLYGFKIVIDLDENDKHAHNKNLKEYTNPLFLRGRFDLLSKITRNGRDIKLKLPTSAVPPLPTQSWGKRKRQISKQDQYNPSAKKIKEEVIDETYHPFEYAGSSIEQIDPYSKKIKQEIIDTSYEGIQSNSPSRAESVCKVENPEYKEISTTRPLFQHTRRCDKQLVSIFKPPTEGVSKVSSPPPSPDVQNETIVQNISGNVDDVQKPTETNFDNSGVGNNSGEPQNAQPAPPVKITQNSSVACNSVESQSAKPAPPIQITQNSGVDCNSVESQSAKPAPPIQMVVEQTDETNILSDIDVITLLTEEKFHQMEMECLTQIKVSNVSTNTAISEVSHEEDLHVIEEIVVLNPQDKSESTVDAIENKDHQYARNYTEERTPNMVNHANDDEGDVFDLLPWRRRPPSSYMFSNVLPPYKAELGCPCPRLINCRDYTFKILKEDMTEPILKSGSENLLWSSSLYRNREAFRKAILHEFFRIVHNKSCIVSNGHGELKPKTIQEVLDYKIKK